MTASDGKDAMPEEEALGDVRADRPALSGPPDAEGASVVERLMGLKTFARSLETVGGEFSREVGLAVQAFRSAGAPSDAGLELVEGYIDRVDGLVAGVHEHERGTEARTEAERDAVEALARATRRLLRGVLSLQVDDKPPLPGAVTLLPRGQAASLVIRLGVAAMPSLPELTRTLSALDVLFYGSGATRTALTKVDDEACEAVIRAEFPDRPARLVAEDVARGLADALFDAVRGAAVEPRPPNAASGERPETLAMRESLIERTTKELLTGLQAQTAFRLGFEGAGRVELVSEKDRLTLADGDEAVREAPLPSP